MRPGAVLGLGWLPAAFYGVAVWFCLERLGLAMQEAVPSSTLFNEFTSVDFIGLLLVTALLVPTAAVSYAATALGRRKEHVAAHFVYGGPEFRLSLALLGFFVVTIAVLAALAFLAQFAIGIGLPKPGEANSGFAMPLDWYGVPLAVWFDGAVAIVLGMVALFLGARFGFYLTALAAAEPHVTLGRAWAMSRGSFWRLAVVQFVLAVPVVLLTAGAIYLVEGDALISTLRTAWSGIPSEGVSALYKLEYEHAGALAGILSVAMLVTSALFAGASSAAYRVTVLGEELSPAVEYSDAPVRIEPSYQEPAHEPAWAAAKAMADAGTPQWPQHEVIAAPGMPELELEEAVPVEEYALAAQSADAHALAPEAAATTLVEEPIAHDATAVEAAPVEEPVAEAAHDPVAETASGPVEAHPAVPQFVSQQEKVIAQIVHSAFKQIPGYVGEAAPGETMHVATAEEPAAVTASEAPPLDPAGLTPEPAKELAQAD
ncbi:MAG TPA: hypothetical protein VGF56_16660 [Rhizomicrobium sp.]|jgi:hypothetical protein